MDGFIFVKSKFTDVGFNQKKKKKTLRVTERQWEGEKEQPRDT